MTDFINAAPANAAPADTAKRSNKRKNEKEVLTAGRIKSLLAKTRAAKGQRTTIWDGGLPGFGVRITDKHLSYIFAGRFPGSDHWTRREIAACNAISLEAARDEAREWIKLIQKGIDPRAAAAQKKLADDRKRADTFSAAVEAYIDDKVIGANPNKPLQRKGKVVARILRKVFVATWKERRSSRPRNGCIPTRPDHG
jgi:hypothetical protein